MNENTELTLDFGQFSGVVFVGRSRGEAAREKFSLDEVDARGTVVHVVIPDTIYAINSSYFLGLFGKSIVNAGSKDQFLGQYRFKCRDSFQQLIDVCIDRALRGVQPLMGE